MIFRPEAALLPLIARTSNAIHLHLAGLLEEAGADMTPEEAMTMRMVSAFRVNSVSKLAEAMLKDRTTVTRFVNQLEARGLLSRTKDPEDRRATVLTITEKGHEAIQQFDPHIIAAVQSMFAGLPIEDIIATNRVLYTILHRCGANSAPLAPGLGDNFPFSPSSE